MKSDFLARRALIILCVVFFLLPFALRGARLAVSRLQSDQAAWLPADLSESQDLAWLKQHFRGEPSFAILTWNGCSDQDESYRLFVEKLKSEVLPEGETLIGDEDFASASDVGTTEEERAARAEERVRELTRGRQWGDQLGLFCAGSSYDDWGGQKEKWFRGTGESWYYITPEGDLFRWNGSTHLLGVLGRAIRRTVLGQRALDGTLMASFGQRPTGANRNSFHDDPQRLTARVLTNVMSGPEMLTALAVPTSPLWPIDADANDPQVAEQVRQEIVNRLRGTFYGPEPYSQFEWLAADLPRVVNDTVQKQLPADWLPRADAFLSELIQKEYDGARSELLAAEPLVKRRHWEALFASLGVPSPGLQTGIIVSLSPVGVAHRSEVLGRGILGEAPGKLIAMAQESGLRVAAAPGIWPAFRSEITTDRTLKMSGPLAETVAFEEEALVSLVQLGCAMTVAGLLISYLLSRRLVVSVVIVASGLLCATFAFAGLSLQPGARDILLVSMPLMVYALGMAGAAHIVRLYRATVAQQGLEGAAFRTLRQSLVPCGMAFLTVVVGILALTANRLAPVREFGLIGAAGCLIAAVLLVCLVPSALQLWPPRFESSLRTEGPTRTLSLRADALWRWFADWLVDNRWLIVGSAGLLLFALAWAALQLKPSVASRSLFGSRTEALRDSVWTEAHLSKTIPLDLVVSVDRGRRRANEGTSQASSSGEQQEGVRFDERYTLLERVQLVAHVQRAVEEILGERGLGLVDRGVSAAVTLPGSIRPEQRGTIEARIEQERERLSRQQFLALDNEGRELWRIGFRVSDAQELSSELFENQLRRAVEPVLKAYDVREEILRHIEKQRGTAGSSDGARATSRIAVLGAADPADESDDAQGVTNLPDSVLGGGFVAHETATERIDRELGVHRVFASTLSDLLRAQGYQSKRSGRDVTQVLSWQDPRKNPLGANARSDKWGKSLANFDCVVLLRDHADYDVDFIRQHAKSVVDARRHGFDPARDATAMQQGKPIAVTYTGLAPVTSRAADEMLAGTLWSLGIALAGVSLLAALIFRTRRTQIVSVAAGLTCLLPVVLPVAVAFGVLAYEQIRIDVGTAIAVCVATGLAVQGAIRYVASYRRFLRAGSDQHGAIQNASSQVVIPLVQSALLLTVCFALWGFSSLVPLQRMGLTLAAVVGMSVMGNLVLVPALLAGPLGRRVGVPYLQEPAGSASDAEHVDDSDVLPLERDARVAASGRHEGHREGRPGATPRVRRDGSHSA
jgi:predicted RND superfamily exporter protein